MKNSATDSTNEILKADHVSTCRSWRRARRGPRPPLTGLRAAAAPPLAAAGAFDAAVPGAFAGDFPGAWTGGAAGGALVTVPVPEPAVVVAAVAAPAPAP